MIRHASKTLATTSALDGADQRRFIDATFFNLFWIFTITSFIGLIGETIVAAFTDGYVKSRAGLV